MELAEKSPYPTGNYKSYVTAYFFCYNLKSEITTFIQDAISSLLREDNHYIVIIGLEPSGTIAVNSADPKRRNLGIWIMVDLYSIIT